MLSVFETDAFTYNLLFCEPTESEADAAMPPDAVDDPRTGKPSTFDLYGCPREHRIAMTPKDVPDRVPIDMKLDYVKPYRPWWVVKELGFHDDELEVPEPVIDASDPPPISKYDVGYHKEHRPPWEPHSSDEEDAAPFCEQDHPDRAPVNKQIEYEEGPKTHWEDETGDHHSASG